MSSRRHSGFQLEYLCDACARMEPAKENGAMPEGWCKILLSRGHFHACCDFCAYRLERGGEMATLPPKITAEFYEAPRRQGGQKKLAFRAVLTGHKSLDEALKRARERAYAARRAVLSANYRASDSGEPDTIVVVVSEPEQSA